MQRTRKRITEHAVCQLIESVSSGWETKHSTVGMIYDCSEMQLQQARMLVTRHQVLRRMRWMIRLLPFIFASCFKIETILFAFTYRPPGSIHFVFLLFILHTKISHNLTMIFFLHIFL